MIYKCNLCGKTFDTHSSTNVVSLGIHVSGHIGKFVMPHTAMTYFKRIEQ